MLFWDMTSKRASTSDERKPKAQATPVHELISDQAAREFLKVSDASIVNARVTELANLIWHHESLSEKEINVRIARAIEHFNSLSPVDGAEAMLAQQMVATHFAAMESLRRAAIPTQLSQARDISLKQAYKLMSLYARQLETLNKHRGKGQQKVTVEHVHVAEGGQAIVGNVAVGSKHQDTTRTPALAQKPDRSAALDLPKAKTVRQRTPK